MLHNPYQFTIQFKNFKQFNNLTLMNQRKYMVSFDDILWKTNI